MATVRNWIVGVMATLIGVLVIGLSIDTSSVAPPHALVWADLEHRIYFAPSCLPTEHVDAEELGEALEVGDASRVIFAIGYLPIYHPGRPGRRAQA